MLALESVGFEVVARAIKLGLPTPNLDPKILEMENRSSSDCSIVLQHCLPHHYSYDGHFKKNIGLFATETDSLSLSSWTEYAELMDELVVFSEQSREACLNSGVTKPIHVVSHAVDVDKYKRERKRVDFGNDDIKIYAIGSWEARKNWIALFRSFHQTFDPNEPVSLVIKTNSSSLSTEELLKEINRITERVKSDLRLYPDNNFYKPEIIIPDYLNPESVQDLHYSCDIYVSTSHGEAVNLSLLDAIGHGNYSVCTRTGGMADILGDSEEIGIAVPCEMSPVSGVHDSLPNLFTGRENWASVNLTQFGRALRTAYNRVKGKRFREDLAVSTQQRIWDFSYQSIGDKLKKIIEE
jgi:glycosyltransferase involved in cell wall biosynthesis